MKRANLRRETILTALTLVLLLPGLAAAEALVIDGGTVRLPRIVGQGRALEIILTGRQVMAEECLALGLCEYVTPSGGAREKAEELAQEIARFPQTCVRVDRRSAIKSQGLSVRDGLIQEWYNGREALVCQIAVGLVSGSSRVNVEPRVT